MINKILIAGYGSIGRRHLRIARQLFPKAKILVLRHKTCLQIPEYADGCTSDIRIAIEFAPDVAVIANPAPQHVTTALPFAERGVHLLIEKPISHNLTDLQVLIDVSIKSGSLLQVGYNLRYLVSLQQFKEYIDSEVIGKILTVRAEIGQYLPSWRPETDYRKSVSAQRKLGGGVLLELSHEIDYLRWIFGDISWVQAHVSQQSDLDIDVEDTAYVICGFDGSNGHLVGNLVMDFIRHDITRGCTVIGEKGTLRWNGVSGTVDLFTISSGKWVTLSQSVNQRDDSYIQEWLHFTRSIEQNDLSIISGKDGFKVIEVINAIRESSETGARVVIKNK